ncbi:MAG: oligosaccharide flippase family protein [Desulfobacteraceae bacterium]|jgi:O-antigen/teichoic acid export membrane protein
MATLGKELKTLFKHGSVYFIGTVLSRLVGFIMIPVYTLYLKAEGYGINELVGLSIEICGIIISTGIAGGIYRFYYEFKDPKDRNTVISTASLAVSGMSFVFIGALCLISPYISAVVLDDKGLWIYFCLAFGGLFFGQHTHLMYTYLRIKEFSIKYLVISLLNLVISLSLNILFIVYLKMGVLGLFWSNFISAAFFAIVCYPMLLWKVGTLFSSVIFKNMLRFNLPIIPANLASLIVNASDRYFIKVFFSIAETGIYSLGYKFGNVVFYFVRVPFMQIWEPRRYALYQEKAPVDIYARVATYFWFVLVFTGLGISILIQDVIKIAATPEFWAAGYYAPVIVLSYVIYAMDNHVGFGILVQKKTEYWTYVNFAMCGVNLVLNFALIPTYGSWGAVVATFFSLLFKVVTLHFVSRKLFYIPFEWGRMGGMLLVAIALYGFSLVVHPETLVNALLYDLGLTFLFLPIIWFFGFISRDEKTVVRKFLLKFRTT